MQNMIEVPEIITADSFLPVTEKANASSANDPVIDFSKCKRIQSSGLKAMVAYAEEMAEKGRHIIIDNIDNSVFKALKITGKQSWFRFIHQGEYYSEKFRSGGPRC